MNGRKTDTLMIRSTLDGNHEEESKRIYMNHQEKFSTIVGNNIIDFGSDGLKDNIQTLIGKIMKMNGSDRIIYIDAKINNKDPNPKKWFWEFESGQTLKFDELDKALGGNRAHIIIRGQGSGAAVTTSIIAKPNRNIYTSNFEESTNDFVDPYEIPAFEDFNDLHKKHEEHAKTLKEKSNHLTKKYIGIRETTWPNDW